MEVRFTNVVARRAWQALAFGTACVLIGCMGEVPTGNDEPEEDPVLDVFGTYDLMMANGGVLPAVVDTLPGCLGENGVGPGTVSVVRGELELREDRSMSIWRSTDQWCWPDHTSDRDDFTGTFEVTADTVIFHVNAGADIEMDQELYQYRTQTLAVYWVTHSLGRREDLTFLKRF